jgi:hypothetical protein
MSAKPDFDELRRKRDEALNALFDAVCKEQGWDRSQVSAHISPDPRGCYCACPDGPCEHEFSGWRDFEDGNGGEAICKKCGMGAMSHDMRCMP